MPSPEATRSVPAEFAPSALHAVAVPPSDVVLGLRDPAGRRSRSRCRCTRSFPARRETAHVVVATGAAASRLGRCPSRARHRQMPRCGRPARRPMLNELPARIQRPVRVAREARRRRRSTSPTLPTGLAAPVFRSHAYSDSWRCECRHRSGTHRLTRRASSRRSGARRRCRRADRQNGAQSRTRSTPRGSPPWCCRLRR